MLVSSDFDFDVMLPWSLDHMELKKKRKTKKQQQQQQQQQKRQKKKTYIFVHL